MNADEMLDGLAGNWSRSGSVVCSMPSSREVEEDRLNERLEDVG